MNKLKIDYPCEWEYRIIGPNEDAMRVAAAQILGDKKYTLLFSNISKAGKYISLSLRTNVISEKERNHIYVSLRKHQEIKSVI